MKFCPNCKIEYEDVAKLCADCGSILVDSLPAPEPLDECDNCGREAPFDMDYCPHCGTLYASDHYSCTQHPIAVAAGVCIICQQLYCSECLTKKQKKYFCEKHKEIEVREDWALVFQSTDFYLAQIIRGKLESAGVTVNPTNTTNPGFMADGMIESAIGRALLRYPIKVYVPLDEYLAAAAVLTDLSPHNEAE